MDFYKITNNTSNPISMNGIYIEAYDNAIFSQDTLSLIDNQYFDSNILINEGIIKSDDKEIVNLNTGIGYYKKPPSGIPKTHLDKEIKDLLKKASSSVSSGEIKNIDLSVDLRNIINKIITEEALVNKISSAVIKETQLESKVKSKLQSVVELKDKIYNQKINYDDLSQDIQNLLEQNPTEAMNYWREPVLTKELLPIDNNRENDIRLSLEDNSLWRWDSSQVWLKIDQTVEESNNPENGGIKDVHVIGEFFAKKGQRIFKSQRPYIMGNNNVQVTYNGILMMEDEDYIEVDEYTIQFNEALQEDDYIVMSRYGTSASSSVSVENIVIDKTSKFVKLNLPYRMNENALRVYLNGILVSQETNGTEGDYIEYNSDTIKFNYDLIKDDRLIIRRESTFSVDIIRDNFLSMQKVYLNLAKQIDLLKKEIRKK